MYEPGYLGSLSTVKEIEAAIEKLPLPERLRLYQNMPQLLGRNAEDLDWQRLGLENFFRMNRRQFVRFHGLCRMRRLAARRSFLATRRLLYGRKCRHHSGAATRVSLRLCAMI